MILLRPYFSTTSLAFLLIISAAATCVVCRTYFVERATHVVNLPALARLQGVMAVVGMSDARHAAWSPVVMCTAVTPRAGSYSQRRSAPMLSGHLMSWIRPDVLLSTTRARARHRHTCWPTEHRQLPAQRAAHRVAVDLEAVGQQRVHAVRRHKVLAQGVGRPCQVHLLSHATGVWNDLLDDPAHLAAVRVTETCEMSQRQLDEARLMAGGC